MSRDATALDPSTTPPVPRTGDVSPAGQSSPPVLRCTCGTQIVGYGFTDAAHPPSSPSGPWLCLFCAATTARYRPGDITQAFTTDPVPAGTSLAPATVHTREDR